MIEQVSHLLCRICHSGELEEIWNLGSLAMSGVFYFPEEEQDFAEISFNLCTNCGLSQLGEGYENSRLYGSRYGYESHLNSSMATHLVEKAKKLEERYVSDRQGVFAIDIASNDGILLSGFGSRVSRLIGIDPLISKFQDHYPDRAEKRQGFFSDHIVSDISKHSVDIITSCSVLYDIESPVSFAQTIGSLLSNKGVWHTEQSYLPLMIETLSYDTICHEHLLYLRLADIFEICQKSDLKIINVEFNDVNGGSVAVDIARKDSSHKEVANLSQLINDEESSTIIWREKLKQFVLKAEHHQRKLNALLKQFRDQGFEIVGLGASTKGNILLQTCDLSFMSRIGEINPNKFGLLTPGTNIKIVPESEILKLDSSHKVCALILPWHFSKGIKAKSKEFLQNGGVLVIPLPLIEIIDRHGSRIVE